jgi:5-enolpyruvylshikimate-3-phosphate synthase
MATGLRALGIDVVETPVCAVIEAPAARWRPWKAMATDRIAMSFAVAAQLAGGAGAHQRCPRTWATSFPRLSCPHRAA